MNGGRMLEFTLFLKSPKDQRHLMESKDSSRYVVHFLCAFT
jgi:hypothetical protein